MARKCAICGKIPTTGHKVSHAKNRSLRRWLPNLQRVHALVDGRPRRIRACTSCIRSGRVIKVPYDASGAKARRASSSA